MALGLRALLDPWLGGQLPFITMFGAVIVVAWYGGALPAITAAVLGYVLANWLFQEPRGTLSWSWAPLFAYILSTALIAALGGAMHRARTRAEESETRLRDFMDHSPAYVLIKDEAGRYEFLNRAAEQLLGLPAGGWRGKTGADLLPAALAGEVARHDREVLEADAPSSFAARLERADGERHLYTTKFPLHDARGRRRVASVAIDVTEQRRAEEERQLEREQLRIVTDTMSVAAARLSGEGRYLWANRVYAEWVGMRPEEIAGRGIAEVLGAQAFAQVAPYVKQVLEGRQVEYERLSQFGGLGERWLHAVLAPTFDAAGRTNGFVVAVADIDELKRAQEQLKLILNVIPAAVQRCNRDLRFMWLNPLWAQWLGTSAAEVVGRRMDEVLPAAAIREIRPYIDRVLGGETVRYERLAELAGRGARWIEVVLVPTDDGFVSIGTDIHERKLAEEERREADRRKDEFLSVLAHELRNPLAPIRNAVALLSKKSALDAEVTWSRDIIERQVEQMTRLVDDLLDIERIARGRLLVRKQPVSLEKLIDLALETSRPHIHAAGHHLSVVLPTERVTLHADAARLAQVFASLLNNAAKYTESRGSISVSAQLEGAEVVVLVETAGKVQEPEPGTGNFGLTLAQGIVALHGGSIEAHGAGPGEGSRFTVRLPSAAGMQPVEEKPAAAPPAAAQFRILVADDNRDAADSLQRILEVYGHDVRVAYDGAAALQLGEAFAPRVAVLDIGMPGRNGYDVARAMRSRQGDRLTLVALTGWGQDGDRRRALEAGFDYHLTKPVDPDALNELLAELGSK